MYANMYIYIYIYIYIGMSKLRRSSLASFSHEAVIYDSGFRAAVAPMGGVCAGRAGGERGEGGPEDPFTPPPARTHFYTHQAVCKH